MTTYWQAGALLTLCASTAWGREGWVAVEPERLAAARGGFVTSEGLALSVGIERSVSVNGTLVSHNTLHIADLRALGTAQPGAFYSLQQGANNALHSGLGQLAGGTVVQNTLNDQAIATRTMISASVNSAELLKELNFLSSLRDAGSLGGR